MERTEGAATKTTTSVYVRVERVLALTQAATRANYEINASRQISPSELARYLIDNFLELAVQKLITDSKK
jgi:hypothetical protein